MKSQAQADVDAEAAEYRASLEAWHALTLREQARQMAAPFLWGVESLEGVREGTGEFARLQRRMSQYVWGRDTPPILERRPVGPLESVVIVDREHRIVASSDPMEVDKRYTDPAEIALLDAALDSPKVRRAAGPPRDDGRVVLELLTGVPNARGDVIGVVRMRFVGGTISSLPVLPRFEVHTQPSFAGPVLAGLVALLGLGFGVLAIGQVVRLTRRIEALAEGVPFPPTRGPGARALSLIEGKLETLSDAVQRDDLMVASLTDALQEGMLVLDKDGRVVIANRLAREFLGLAQASGEELQQRFLTARNACPALEGVIVEGLDRGLAVREKMLELTAPGGESLELQANSYVGRGQRHSHHLMLVLKDRKRIASLERNLREASRLVTIAQLTGSFAHEVRNPLGAIRVNLDILQRKLDRGGDADPAAEKTLRVLREEIARLNGILEEWLALTAPEERAAADADVADVADSVARLLKVEARHQHVELSVERDLDIGRAAISTARLRQVLLNLALNGLQAMPSGGRLVLRAKALGDRAVLEVEDTGSGIPEAVRDRIFDFHFTTREQGSGLGLAICRRIVEEAGGTISFLSRVGTGTTFTVTLPASAMGNKRPPPGAPAA
ncbi:MAG: ATP-binding protein [Acidobacteria bacterium]|nr:ATP-binding protein [Acidobacteriota bacterium]